MIRLFNYIRTTWEGDDRKPSYRRVAQLIFIGLTIRQAIVGFDTLNQIYALIIFIVAFLLLAAIITLQQVIDCMNIIRKGQIQDNILDTDALPADLHFTQSKPQIENGFTSTVPMASE